MEKGLKMGANHPKERVQKTYLPRRESNRVSDKGGCPQIEDLCQEDKPELTDEQIKLIQSTWKILQEDMAKVGILMFMR